MMAYSNTQLAFIIRVFDKILAWTKLAQAKLWVMRQCIKFFNCSNLALNSNFIIFHPVLHEQYWPMFFTVAPMWSKSYHTSGPKPEHLPALFGAS